MSNCTPVQIVRRLAAFAVVLAVMLPGHVSAQDNDLERFELFTSCASMKLTVGE